MKIVIFCIDDLFFVPELLEGVIKEYSNCIVKAYVSKSLFSLKKLRRKLPFFIKNGYPFCIKISDLMRYACWRLRLKLFGHQGHRSLLGYFHSKGVTAEYIHDINDPDVLRYLESLEADVFLFVPFDKIAKTPFINIPKRGVFNVHLGKLPDYRGGLSAFWVLCKGDLLAGASMHRVVEKIDAGALIAEVRLDVKTNNMRKLMTETVRNSSQMIVQGLKRIENNPDFVIDVAGRENRYFLYPELKDFHAFYRRGCQLI